MPNLHFVSIFSLLFLVVYLMADRVIFNYMKSN